MPGIQDKNSNPDNEFSSAKFETFLSKVEEPAISIFWLNKDICEKDINKTKDKIEKLEDENVVWENINREENKEDREVIMARFKTYMNKRTIREWYNLIQDC